MVNIENIAEKVISKTEISPEQKFGSVLAIIMIVGIIINVIRVVQECEKVKDIEGFSEEQSCTFWQNRFKFLANKKTWFTRMRLRQIIRKHLGKDDYIKYKTQLHDAILDVGSSLSDEETYGLMEAFK